MYTTSFLIDSLTKFLNLSQYKHLLILIVYIFTTYIIVELFYIKNIVMHNSTYINNLKKQSILHFLNNYNDKKYAVNYIDLYFVAEYCIELMDKDKLIYLPCTKILNIAYTYK